MAGNPYYIITGAPSTGKTSILNELRNRGFICHQEIAREVIRENLDTGIDIFPWNNMHGFSDLVLERMINLVKTFEPTTTQFLDRSMVDLIGYMKFANNPVPPHYIREALSVGYSKKVFFLPLWTEIYTQDEERKESIEEAEKIGNALAETYQSLGFDLIEVPHAPLNDRVSFILSECEQFQEL
ncbi:AAA family ATPase [Parvicella tangerina]|uniref:NadR/Ttd14 AAA domain-containing protein n=1 Tax=Parvicella tangerina TaxID=2829795 RepID=A0A916N8U5_9FLAO|nr:AAA family ATPase [Parvicella tangerina]CAG5077634.1 hypothetical protein CRYO30217_00445 [Parvicella tangerina]